MKPNYFIENAYSIYPPFSRPTIANKYEVETPETQFEWQVFQLFHQGKKQLYREEYALALDSFQEVSHLILKTVHPKLPANPYVNYYQKIPPMMELVEPMMKRSAEILRDTPIPRYAFPATIVDKNMPLSAELATKIDQGNDAGISMGTSRTAVNDLVEGAIQAAEKRNMAEALNLYSEALKVVPETDKALQAHLKHDMAILNEKINKSGEAVKLANESASLFEATKNVENQVKSLNFLNTVLTLSDKATEAKEVQVKIDSLVKSNHGQFLNTASIALAGTSITPAGTLTGNISELVKSPGNGGATPSTAAKNADLNVSDNLGVRSQASPLISMDYLVSQPAVEEKKITINGMEKNVSIPLSGNLINGMKGYYSDLAVTRDLGRLTGFLINPTQMVAYLPHMYFYIIPMAMADCEIGMGKNMAAANRMENVLAYPYLNADVEVINIWTKLADCILDLGDESYKNAKDEVAKYASAQTWYEKIVKTDGTLDEQSPLYKNPKFSKIKQRVLDVLKGPKISFTLDGTTTLTENPVIVIKIREAETMLFQIQSKLNFFGFHKDYIPPFSFQYLQDTARYFAQHASQMEQKYIQYKSTAENEELRADQMTQQVELAQESVILEKRGVAEAQAGIDVATANREYAETRKKNAVDQKNEFNDVKWELLEYAQAESWASASSVDGDDQVKLTWNGNYYNSSKKKRNVVLKELAYHKTKITNELQASKLADEVAAAEDFQAVAEAQVVQAQARKAVADKRVEIAQLQQKHAEENKEFLDLKEFGAGKWYDIAKKTKRLVSRYLNQATEIAFLMERAYNAETERGINVIRYNYAPSYSGFLVGADNLTKDIDHLTFDYITNIKTKKAPVKKTISLSDHAPAAFERLLSTGKCQFATKLTDFDRDFPGMYLCKVKNVELLFVGITKAVSIAGSLRNIGVSKFKRSNGTVFSRVYPADVMPLSQYDIRQDALAFRFDPKDLKLFENNGLETIWELRLMKDANNFDFREILDIQMILYYDGFYNTTLESTITASLPSSGSASRSFSMQLYFPDELYYLRNQGEGLLEFEPNMFPFNQDNLTRTNTQLKVLGDGTAEKGLSLELHSEATGKTLKIKTDQTGKVAAANFTDLKDGSMADRWSIKIPKEGNPQLVKENKPDFSGIRDVIFLVNYKFDYLS